MSGGFEMSTAGQLPAETVVECGVCWWTYDPTIGDKAHDLVPNVGFSELAENFRCPACDASKDKFMVKPGGPETATTAVHTKVSFEERLDSLKSAYRKAEEAMVGLPVYNDKLDIELVGFRQTDEGYAGIVITPWAMNIAVLPEQPTPLPAGPIGSNRDISFPSGTYSFLAARLDGFGALETCNLISPMDDFDDHAVAKMTADAALEGLFEAPKPPAPSRRAFLRGSARVKQEEVAVT